MDSSHEIFDIEITKITVGIFSSLFYLHTTSASTKVVYITTVAKKMNYYDYNV